MVGSIWCCHLKVNNLCYAKLETSELMACQ